MLPLPRMACKAVRDRPHWRSATPVAPVRLFSLTREGHRPRALQPAYLTLLEETFARGPQSAAKVAALAVIRAGAGLNLEDPVDTEPPGRVGSFGKGDASELVEPEEQAERIRAANRESARWPGAAGGQRQDRRLLEGDRRSGDALRSGSGGRAYLDAGAECVFVPGVKDTDPLAALVREIPGPLNILAGPSPSVAELRLRRAARQRGIGTRESGHGADAQDRSGVAAEWRTPPWAVTRFPTPSSAPSSVTTGPSLQEGASGAPGSSMADDHLSPNT